MAAVADVVSRDNAVRLKGLANELALVVNMAMPVMVTVAVLLPGADANVVAVPRGLSGYKGV